MVSMIMQSAASGDTQTLRLSIEGMTCASWVARVEKALRSTHVNCLVMRMMEFFLHISPSGYSENHEYSALYPSRSELGECGSDYI